MVKGGTNGYFIIVIIVTIVCPIIQYMLRM